MRLSAALLAMAMMLSVTVARAHPLAPVVVDARRAGQAVTVRFKRARVQPRGTSLGLRLPDDCERMGEPERRRSDEAVTEVTTLRCPGPLAGRRFGVRGLAESGLDAIVQVDDGERVHRALLSDDESMVVPAAPAALGVVRDYGVLGARHMLGGFDHLLFVLALWLLARDRRRLVIAITSFTLGHSVTLGLATLGYVEIAGAAWIELGIAASLLVMAVPVIESARSEAGRGMAWVTAAFGLLHGLGFAGALAEAGIPPGEAPLALGSFNVGVELAQLGVVAAAALLARLGGERLTNLRWPRRVVGYALGSVAAMWCIDRALAVVA